VYALERGLEQSSFSQLHYRLNRFEKYLGRPAEYADFNDGEMNMFLHALLQEGLSPENVKDHRRNLLTLWRAMFDHMLVDQLPLRVRKVKCPSKPPKAWTMPQLVKLVETAGTLRGCFQRFPNIRRASFWRGFVLLKYHTGLRLGDVLALRWSDIAENGMLTVTMRKTGDIVHHQLSAEVLLAISPLKRSDKPRVFGDLMNRSNVMEGFRRLRHAAGLTEGTSRWLRRSAATHIEIVSPGAAKAFLGHRTSGLADRNYIDASIVQRQKPAPPRIEGPRKIG
jgi:integrase